MSSTAVPEPAGLTRRSGPGTDLPSGREDIAQGSDGVEASSAGSENTGKDVVGRTNNGQAKKRRLQRREKKDEDPSLVMIVTPVLLVFLAYVAFRVGAFAVNP